MPASTAEWTRWSQTRRRPCRVLSEVTRASQLAPSPAFRRTASGLSGVMGRLSLITRPGYSRPECGGPRPGGIGGSPAGLVEPPAGRSAEPGRDPGAALSADQLVGSGDRPQAVVSVLVNTVRTHIRHVCGKLGAHGATEAVAR